MWNAIPGCPDKLKPGEPPFASGDFSLTYPYPPSSFLRPVALSAALPVKTEMQVEFGEWTSVAVFAQVFHRQRGLHIQLAQQLLDVLGEDVALQVDPRAGAIAGQCSVAVCVWNDGH